MAEYYTLVCPKVITGAPSEGRNDTGQCLAGLAFCKYPNKKGIEYE